MVKKKEISGYVKLQIKGGQANPAPPVGPALGQRGINIMEFCKAFNDKTKSFAGKPIPVIITVYKDKKFDFEIKSPPAFTTPFLIPNAIIFAFALLAAYPFPIAPNPIFIPFSFKKTVLFSLLVMMFL